MVSRGSRALLAIGFLSVAFFIVGYRITPISGYELSLYTAIPLWTWGAFFLGVGATIWLVTTRDVITREVTVPLTILLAFCLAGLPVIRGYSLYATSDTMGHVSWLQDIMAGVDVSHVLIYPGFHFLVAIIARITGLPIEWSLMLVVPVVVGLATLSLEMAGRRIVPNKYSHGVGALLGLVFLPVFTVQLPTLSSMPMTLAVFFLFFVLFVALVDLRPASNEVSVLLVSVLALVFFHPIIAISFIGSLSVISVYFVIVRSPSNWKQVPTYRIPTLVAIVSGIVLYYQLINKPSFGGAVVTAFSSLSSGVGTTEHLAGRANAASGIGTSITEILAKIFAPKLLIGIIGWTAGLRALYSFWQGDRDYLTIMKVAFILALIPAVGLAGLYFVGGYINQITRYVGYILVFSGVFAVLGLSLLRERATQSSVIKAIVFTILIVSVSFTVPMLYQSPYIHQGSPHQPDSKVTGYSTLFDYQSSSIGIAAMRSLPDRQRAAYYGRSASQGNGNVQSNFEALAKMDNSRALPFFMSYHFNGTDPSKTIDSEIYLAVPESDYIIDIAIYDGFRYNESDYRRLRNDRGGAHIYTNGGFDGYLITPQED